MKSAELVAAYNDGASISSPARRHKKAWSTIKSVLVAHGAQLRSVEEAKALSRHRSRPMSQQLMSRLTGELLEDGAIEMGKKLSCFAFSSKHKDYMSWLARLVSVDVPLAKGRVREVCSYDKRTGKQYTQHRFRTLGTVEIHALGTMWYPDAVKTVPDDLRLDRHILLHWWLGDGSVGNRCGFLCTDNFTDVRRLSFLLNSTWNWNTRPRKRTNPSGTRVTRIYIPRTSLERMWGIMDDPPIASLAYRWRLQS